MIGRRCRALPGGAHGRARVTDQGSVSIASPASCGCGMPETTPVTARPGSGAATRQRSLPEKPPVVFLHWKIGTIAREFNVHPDAVRNAIESDRFNRTQPMRPSITDPFMEFVGQTLDQHPRLRPTAHEPFLKLQAFPAEHYGEFGVMLRTAWPVAGAHCRAAYFATRSFP